MAPTSDLGDCPACDRTQVRLVKSPHLDAGVRVCLGCNRAAKEARESEAAQGGPEPPANAPTGKAAERGLTPAPGGYCARCSRRAEKLTTLAKYGLAGNYCTTCAVTIRKCHRQGRPVAAIDPSMRRDAPRPESEICPRCGVTAPLVRTKHHPVPICRHCVKIIVQKAWRDGKKGKPPAADGVRAGVKKLKECVASGAILIVPDPALAAASSGGSDHAMDAARYLSVGRDLPPIATGWRGLDLTGVRQRPVVIRVTCHEYSDVTRVLEAVEGMNVGIGLEGSR